MTPAGGPSPPPRPALGGTELPFAASDRGIQMTLRATRQFYFDLGVVQSFSRPRTPPITGAVSTGRPGPSASACTPPTPPPLPPPRSWRSSTGSSSLVRDVGGRRGLGWVAP